MTDVQKDTEQAIEKALSEMQESSRNAQTLISQIETATHIIREIGRGLADIGNADAKETTAFSVHIEREITRFANTLVKRKRAELAKLERIIGPLTHHQDGRQDGGVQ